MSSPCSATIRWSSRSSTSSRPNRSARSAYPIMPPRRAHDSTSPVSRNSGIQGPLGIIAGGGQLPCVIAGAAVARGLDLHIVGIRGEARTEIERFPHTWIKWGEVGKLFAALDENRCRDLVIIGGVTRP